jgi:hypothetical protein
VGTAAGELEVLPDLFSRRYDDNRNLLKVGGIIFLDDAETDEGIAVAVGDFQLLHCEFRNIAAVEPLGEKILQFEAGNAFKAGEQVSPACRPVDGTLVEITQGGSKDVGTDPVAQHMEKHGGLIVADGPDTLRPRVSMTDITEAAQGEIHLRPDITLVLHQLLLAVNRTPALVGSKGLVGQVGGQALGPVAFPGGHAHAVAEPGVENFVAEGGVDDKGEPHHRLATGRGG